MWWTASRQAKATKHFGSGSAILQKWSFICKIRLKKPNKLIFVKLFIQYRLQIVGCICNQYKSAISFVSFFSLKLATICKEQHGKNPRALLVDDISSQREGKPVVLPEVDNTTTIVLPLWSLKPKSTEQVKPWIKLNLFRSGCINQSEFVILAIDN